MSLTPTRLSELRTVYRDGLLKSTIPFWLRHGLDRDHGGLITGLAEDGTVIDTDKAVWLQGRAAWTFATLSHRIERNPEWLAASKHCLDFIRTRCRGPAGKLYFTVTRDGRPLRMRRYVYSECVAAIGSAAYAKATGDEHAAREARQYFETYLHHSFTPGVMPPKTDPGTRPIQGVAPHTVAIVAAQEIRTLPGDVTDSGGQTTGSGRNLQRATEFLLGATRFAAASCALEPDAHRLIRRVAGCGPRTSDRNQICPIP